MISLFEYVGPFATQVGQGMFSIVVANNYSCESFGVLHRLSTSTKILYKLFKQYFIK